MLVGCTEIIAGFIGIFTALVLQIAIKYIYINFLCILESYTFVI